MKDTLPDNPEETFNTLTNYMKTMYQEVDLIHADLSEYNILVHESKPIIIDVGQAVLKNHPMADEFLERDVANITRFFNKLGVSSNSEELLAQIRGDA